MKIIHDYQCEVCQEVTEFYVDSKDQSKKVCPICNGYCTKVFLPQKRDTVDAPWISTVLEVVEKGSDKPHCNEFLKHPTRANYNTWKNKEGVRHLEQGERKSKNDNTFKKAQMKKELHRRYREREAVSI